MTDLRALLDVPFHDARTLMVDEIDMARKAVMTDLENALRSAAETIHPDADLTHADILATLDWLKSTVDKLLAAMTALCEELAQKNKRLR